MAPPGIERRIHARYPLRTPIQLSSPAFPTITARAIDISLGGMGVVSPVNLTPGLTVRVRLMLPQHSHESRLFDVDAQVAYGVYRGSEGGFFTGLRFTQMSAVAETALRAFLPTP